MSRVRSPNYPAVSLPTAVEKARVLHKAEGRNAASREAAVKVMGYGTLNGASATILSALNKYGLIEAAGEGEVRVTDLGMRVMFPHDDSERTEAFHESAYRPTLFSELKEKWPDRRPSDENLRSYLVRKGFTQSATEQVIQFYRETLDMVGEPTPAQSPSVHVSKETPMTPAAAVKPPAAPLSPATGGKPFSIGFDGTMLTGSIAIRSVKEIDRLMKVLQAQKAAFEAMEDDEEEANQATSPSEVDD